MSGADRGAGAARPRVSVLGGSGYTGGELCRLLLGHGGVELAQVTSRGQRGEPITAAHPNLRSLTELSFVDPDDLAPCDVLFCCLPHGELAGRIGEVAGVAPRIIDLSADFRIRDAGRYRAWYGVEHPSPEWLGRFVYGLPELRREEIRVATHVSGVGCNATAMNLALAPLARLGVIEHAVVEVKVGSSEAGAASSASSHHPERASAVRTYSPAGHRHQAEVEQELMERFGGFALSVTGTALPMVRGVLCTAHVFTREPLDNPHVWSAFRECFAGERFVRVVKGRKGIFRYPEPAILSGSNFADVGFEIDVSVGALAPGSRPRVVCLSAIDNMMKGAAGSAVQCMNLMCGFDEGEGLGFAGLHPV